LCPLVCSYAIAYAVVYNKHQEVEEKTVSLKDKVVLITGGGSGIGADAAQAFYTAGAKVVLNGRRENMLSQIAAKIDPTGKNIAYVVGDIGQSETSDRVASLAVEKFGGVDILFNNAGVFQPKPFLEHTHTDLDGYLNLLRGYFLMSQAAIKVMQKRGGGAIINIGSMWVSMRSPPLHVVVPQPPKVAYML
jgi:NAD(P)-dependent dehydrogenase (short-subunit alcohol dehydrogenase family)